MEPLLIIFGFVFLVVLVESVTKAIVKIKTAEGGGGGKGSKLSEDDVRMMQDLYKGLERLNERVESLETILMDRVKKE